jgi:hypothetical protein
MKILVLFFIFSWISSAVDPSPHEPSDSYDLLQESSLSYSSDDISTGETIYILTAEDPALQLKICNTRPMALRFVIAFASIFLMTFNHVNMNLCEDIMTDWISYICFSILAGSNLVEMIIDVSVSVVMISTGCLYLSALPNWTRSSQFVFATTLLMADILLSSLEYSSLVEGFGEIDNFFRSNQDLCPTVWLPGYWVVYTSVAIQFVIAIILKYIFDHT